MAYTTINPYNGELLAQFDTLTAEQLEHKLAAAAQCYATWKHTTYAQRASIIAKAGELMHQRFDALARKITLEMGKRIDEARGEVKFSADIMAYYAKNAERFLAPQALEPSQGEAHMESSPIGVIFGVATDDSETAFALTMNQVAQAVQGQPLTQQVSTQGCVTN